MKSECIGSASAIITHQIRSDGTTHPVDGVLKMDCERSVKNCFLKQRRFMSSDTSVGVVGPDVETTSQRLVDLWGTLKSECTDDILAKISSKV